MISDKLKNGVMTAKKFLHNFRYAFDKIKKAKQIDALKKIIAHDIEELEGFEEEFELVYISVHPNVMKIYGICVNILDSTTFALYVLMELALGDWNDEIKKHLSVRKHYKEDDLINILKQIVSSLLFMQEKMKLGVKRF